MTIFLATSRTSGLWQDLNNAVERLPAKPSIERVPSLSALRQQLRRPRNGLTVLVFLAQDSGDMKDLAEAADLLQDIKIILILPDRKPETVAAGHRLTPRFLSFSDKGVEEATEVLGHMLSKYQVH